MIVQVMRSKYANFDGRWWFGVKRWPSRKYQAELETLGPPNWKMVGWFIGFGPFQIRIWPGLKKD